MQRLLTKKPGSSGARRAGENLYGGRARFLQGGHFGGHFGALLGPLVAALLAAAPAAGGQAAPAEAGKREIVILALGDSLTAGYGLPASAAFPAVLERRLRAEGIDARVVNAGVSGDTASGGLARLDWALGEGADAAIVELGANDMLRGIDPKVTQAALRAILDRLRARGAPVLLAGMRASGNLDKAYRAEFDAIYPELARESGAALHPFFLEGVFGRPELLLPDGLHPNAAGVEAIVAAILPEARALAEKAGAAPAPAQPSPEKPSAPGLGGAPKENAASKG